MNTSEVQPTFNLKAVVLETGVKSHTLRAWEQRYGLPQPLRTNGNQRIYTQQDIDTVKWLMARLEEGMTISRAVELWHHLKERGENSSNLTAYQASELPVTSTAGNALADLRQKWIAHCLKFDKVAAEDVLTQAFAIYPVKMVCLEILQKGLAHIDNLWFHNKGTVHQEHFTSALILERLSALVAAAPPPTRIGRILLACPSHEEHTIGLLLLSLLLRHRGWEVIYLGANVPIVQLDFTLEMVKPQLVVLAAQRLQTAASLAKVAHFLKDKGVNTAFGGAIFNLIPALRPRICGHFLGESIEDAVGVIGQIMAFNPPVPKVEPTPEVYTQASNHYRAKRHLIELDIRQLLEGEKFPHEYMNETHSRYAQDILAALDLGEMNFINSEMKLTRHLISNHGISWDWQGMYVEAYFHAAQKNLRGDGLPIIEWLDGVRSDLSLR